MPLVGFRSTYPGDEKLIIEFDDAAAYFDRRAIMPEDAMRALLASIHDNHREQSPRYMSPSMFSPATTCRREVLIKDHWPYYSKPQDMWSMQAGTLMHGVMQGAVRELQDGPLREAMLPDKSMAGVGKVCEDDFRRVEVLPGIWVCGTVDKLSADRLTIEDYKTAKFPKVTYRGGSREIKIRNFDASNASEWAYQLTGYGLITKACFGVAPKQAFVWRMYHGSHLPDETWHRQPVELLSADQLDANSGDWMREFVGWKERMTDAASAAERETILEGVPLDGEVKQIFHGQKCTKYCEVANICADLNGDLEF